MLFINYTFLPNHSLDLNFHISTKLHTIPLPPKPCQRKIVLLLLPPQLMYLLLSVMVLISRIPTMCQLTFHEHSQIYTKEKANLGALLQKTVAQNNFHYIFIYVCFHYYFIYILFFSPIRKQSGFSHNFLLIHVILQQPSEVCQGEKS